ncbi:hypothetical protein GEMRC1_004378 [Eukaryota sp. GEM-RC1]
MTEHDPEDPELERSPPDDQLSLSNCYTVLATGIDPLPKSDRFIQRQVVPFWSEDEEQQFSSSTQKELLFLLNLKDKVEPNTSSFLFGKKFFRKKPQTTNQTSQIQRPRKTPVSSLFVPLMFMWWSSKKQAIEDTESAEDKEIAQDDSRFKMPDEMKINFRAKLNLQTKYSADWID